MNWIIEQFLSFSLNGIWGVVFLFFAASWFLMMAFYWIIFVRLAFYKSKKQDVSTEDLPAVSVVIAARNEYNNLSTFLPQVLEQDYPEFEVVVVNDASNDDSVELLDEMKRKYNHLKVINLHENINFFKGKKFPLSVGIRSAKNEHLILTDADCRPSSKRWISRMMEFYEDNTEVVIGYGKYESKSGLMNMLQRYDTVFTAMQYISFALAGMPYMGVGRNLSYLKTLFNRQKGFSSHYRIKSGDDDLFINKVSSSGNTKVCLDKEAMTISRSTSGFGRWITQKRRHLTTGKYYRFRHKLWLGVLNFSRMLFWFTLIALLIRFYNGVYVISAGALMLFSFLFILKRSMNNLGEKNLLLISPLLELMLLITYLFINFANLIRKPDKWK